MKIGFLGAGNMAEALIRGVLKAKAFKAKDILISDLSSERLNYLARSCKVKAAKDNASLIAGSNAVIIAVKPRDIDGALAEIKANIKKDAPVISIAAAISTAYIEAGIGGKNPVIRAMPNTPALVLSGMAAVSKGKFAGEKDIALAKKILGSVGKVIEVDEVLMDIVTAVSGSGPAYVFLFIEALVEAGIKNGLGKQAAETLAYNTVLGAAKMVIETQEAPGVLRQRVTSPGGTTMEAIKVFENREFKAVIEAAVKACMEKSKQLTK
jgi:pyrroline-5-carboxylate reductase